ncbi:MAG: DNA polymerase V [Betaproteobacteria bacterium]|nr:DNA polymerase V [Betaproteobacteria bacterium]MDE2424005.1 DNA polymerase V [Betaproteobacteria bacterium]
MTQHLAFFPAQEEQHTLNLLRYLMPHPESTFFFRAQSQALEASGIFKNDLLIVDRSATPHSGQVVIAYLRNEFLVRRLRIHHHEGYLEADDPRYHTVKLTDAEDSLIWGVVTWVIHRP